MLVFSLEHTKKMKTKMKQKYQILSKMNQIQPF